MKKVTKKFDDYHADDGTVFTGPDAKRNCLNYEKLVLPRTQAKTAVLEFVEKMLPETTFTDAELCKVELLLGACDRRISELNKLLGRHKLGKIFVEQDAAKAAKPAAKPAQRKAKEPQGAAPVKAADKPADKPATKTVARGAREAAVREASYAPGQVIPANDPGAPSIRVVHGPDRLKTVLPAKLGMTLDEIHIAIQLLQRPIHDLQLVVGGRGTILALPPK